ncbi:MAG: diacylglycerol kinase [Verrucomicrobiota bacterium]|nr:diacylglycerol kinase [Verrucomicrobiota bacterium]
MIPPDTSANKTPNAAAPEVEKGGGVMRIWRAFFYSMEGLHACFKLEAAFRQEVYLAAVLLPLAIILPLPILAKLWLISSIFIVLITEMLNSAIEWVVDLAAKERHLYAKRSKDMGSAAVFLSLCHLGIAWVLILCANWHGLKDWLGL